MPKIRKIKFNDLKTALIFVIIALFIFSIFYDNKDNNANAQTSGKDAIAIRVIPNIEHYSALRWYKNQKFTGSPQSLLVDGYGAVRDGRTIYVNVANVSSGDNTIYTNIYLITYNQEAEKATSDIFGSIIKYWKFNTNISDRGHCRKNNLIICAMDNECPIGDFCDSRKSLVIRDTRRLEDLAEIRIGLKNYFTRGYYPALAAGTYLPNKTVSVWPSWREQFREEIGISLPLDPVNQLGKCCPSGAINCDASGNYNPETCWDENRKIFATTLPDKLPGSSLAYIYSTNTLGLNYNLCAILESGLAIGGSQLIDVVCPSICLDMDYDGYGLFATAACLEHPGLIDCDDTNAAVAAGGAEICDNNIDDDCDGLIDCNDADCALNANCIIVSACIVNGNCGTGETCANCPSDCCCGDGLCNSATECLGGTYPCPVDCACGNSRRDCGEECDGEINCSTGCTWLAPACTDADKDRYIAESTAIASCGNVCGVGNEPCLGNNDCNDFNNIIYPGRAEVCDGLDNDCDGSIDEDFTEESCGFLCVFNYNASRAGSLRCCGDDAKEAGPYEITETSCADSRDNDCDGTFDNDIVNAVNPDTDCLACNAGNSLNESFWYLFDQPDCNQCNHAGDDDGDQFSEDWSAYPNMADTCDANCGVVSANVPRSAYEPNNETSCDGIDNDCDGEIDEGIKTTYYLDSDTDTYGDPNVSNDYCPALKPANYVNNNSDCDDTNASIRPGIAEVCDDGIDNNCDGNIDEGCVLNTYCVDSDEDNFGNPSTAVSASAPPDSTFVADCTDCDDTKDYVRPGGTETCDGNDNDCDSATDEGCDDDNDDYCDNAMPWFITTSVCPFTLAGPNGNDCDDNNALRFPNNQEFCDNIDNDCNNTTADGSGELFYEAGMEITCNDGNDNDCDGDIDSADNDCPNTCIFDFEFPCVLN